MENISEAIMAIPEEIESDYFIGEFGVNSKLTRAIETTEYKEQYLDMVMAFREVIGMMVDLSMDMD